MILARQGVVILVLFYAILPSFSTAVEYRQRKPFVKLIKDPTGSHGTKWAPSVYIQRNLLFLTGYHGLFKSCFKYSFLLCTRLVGNNALDTCKSSIIYTRLYCYPSYTILWHVSHSSKLSIKRWPVSWNRWSSINIIYIDIKVHGKKIISLPC
jgi:hypothetical protein